MSQHQGLTRQWMSKSCRRSEGPIHAVFAPIIDLCRHQSAPPFTSSASHNTQVLLPALWWRQGFPSGLLSCTAVVSALGFEERHSHTKEPSNDYPTGAAPSEKPDVCLSPSHLCATTIDRFGKTIVQLCHFSCLYFLSRVDLLTVGGIL